jgi:hypothetical protein
MSDIRLCSRMQKTPTLFPTGGRTTMSSGRIRQNLSFTISSFDLSSWTLLASVCVRGRSISRALNTFHIVSFVRIRYCRSSISDGISFQNVWRHFSPEIHKNFASQVYWIWPRFCSGRSLSVVNQSSVIQRVLHRSHLSDSDSFFFVIC